MKVKFILAAIWVMAMLMGCSMEINGGRNNNSSVNTWDVSKSTVKKSYNISQFSKIEAANGIKVIFTQGKFTGKADVQMTPTAEKYLEIKVDEGTLELSYRSLNENINGPTIVRVQAPQLTSIDLSSSASVEMNGTLKVDRKLDIELSSAASVTAGDVSGVEVEIDLSSASKVTMGNLNLNKLDIEQSSASECNIGKVTAVNMDVDLSSASRCEIAGFNGTGVDAEASSGSNIKIYGISAQTVKAEASSGADITLEGKCGKAYIDKSSGAGIDVRRLKSNASSVSSSETSSQTPNKTIPREP